MRERLLKSNDGRSAHALVVRVQPDPDRVLVDVSPELFAPSSRPHNELADKERSVTDRISFHLMHERGIARAVAYDVHLEQAGFDPLLRREPPA